ncbi:MAG: hypothetical protein KBD16_00555 [Candidatus Pacebacteria bacterium]|nr:hypothetical protein [Candidatus Paceibacterota bacterium]
MQRPSFFSKARYVLICGALVCIPFLVGAEEPPTDYLLVKDLPFVGQTTSIASYFNGIFRLGLGLAITFAILMIVVNGIKYMVSDAVGDKMSAKDIIKGAVIGLLIVFGSVLVLNTVNPEITKFNLQGTIDRTVAAIKTGQYAKNPIPTDRTLWPDDSAERRILGSTCVPNGGTCALVSVENKSCTYVGETDCTSVYGLSKDVLASIINLSLKCKCSVTVTSGTEYWLHSTHRDNRTVDLRADVTLGQYLGGNGDSCGVTREKDGHNFVWEDKSCSWCANRSDCGAHWHVTF